MRLFAIIDASPWPSFPVFFTSLLMPVVYVVAAAAPEPHSVDPLMMAVLFRVALHLALKLPTTLEWARSRSGPDPMLVFVAIVASGVLLALVWTNDARAAQIIWSLMVGLIGLVDLWQAMAQMPSGSTSDTDDWRQSMAVDGPMLRAGNHLIFSLVCAMIAAFGPWTVWVLYAAIGWVPQFWCLAWVSIATQSPVESR